MKQIIIVTLIVISIMPCISLSAEERGLQLMSIKTQSGQEVGLYQESHALLIGVSDYTAGWPDLPGVTADLQAVQTILEHHGFQVVTVANPTRERLDHAFTEFINQYGLEPDNRLLFYFAGHGYTMKLAYGEEMGYIVPADAPNPNQDANGFLTSAMDMQMIEVYAKRIQAKHALFLFDSCFSGSIFALARAIPENISYKSARPVRQFLTSGGAEEQVPDESIFRQQLIVALQGEGDVNGDGYVTGTELGEYLQSTVVNYSKGSQHPQYGKIRNPNLDKGDFIFQVPGVTVYIDNRVQISPDSGSALDPETEMWELVKDSTDMLDIQDFLDTFPNGRLTKVAEFKLKQLQRRQSQTPIPQATPTQPQPTAAPTPANVSTGSNIEAFAADWGWSRSRHQDGRYGITSVTMPAEFLQLTTIDTATLSFKSSYSQQAGQAQANVYISTQNVAPKDAQHDKGHCWYSDQLNGGEHQVGSYTTVYRSQEIFSFDITAWIRQHRAPQYFIIIENKDIADIGVGSIRIHFRGK